MSGFFRKIAALVPLLLLAGCTPTEDGAAMQAEPARTEVSVTLGGEELTLETPALLVDGVLMLPADDIFPALGLELLFPGSLHVAMARGEAVSIDVTAGSRVMVADSTPVLMAAEPAVFDGRLYVPECAVKYGVGAAVEWDEAMTAAGIGLLPHADRRWDEDGLPTYSHDFSMDDAREVAITLHGEPIALNSPALAIGSVPVSSAISVGGILMLPSDDIFPALGLELLFPGSRHVVMARSEVISVDLTVGSRIMIADDFPIMMAAAPVVIDGRVYVPECAVKYGVGAAVSWNTLMTVGDIERRPFVLRLWVDETELEQDEELWAYVVFRNQSNETFKLRISDGSPSHSFTGWTPFLPDISINFLWPTAFQGTIEPGRVLTFSDLRGSPRVGARVRVTRESPALRPGPDFEIGTHELRYWLSFNTDGTLNSRGLSSNTVAVTVR